jgi:hypothetical protein
LKKNIITILSILFILFFILWASGCHLWEASRAFDSDQKSGESLSGCFVAAAAQGMFETRTNTEKMRQYMEERTGQSFEGWTLYEMQLMEMELDRLEKEKKEAVLQAQDSETPQVEQGQGTTQSQAAQEPFKSDEGPHKKDPQDRNAPSSGYESYEENDPYYDEAAIQEIVASRDLNGRWRHSMGEIIFISGQTGTFEVFNPVHQKFVDLGMIQIGDVRLHNIRPITSFSELDDMRWLGGYLLEIKNMVGDGDFSEVAALWRCSRTIFVWDGWTDEPLRIEVDER